MKVEIIKIVVKHKLPYNVPAKYSSNTFSRLYIDGEFKGEYQNAVYGGLKKLVEILQKRYGFIEFEKKDGGSIREY